MPPDVLPQTSTAGRTGVRATQVVVGAPTDPGGSLTVHPAFAEQLTRAGLTCAAAFLDLPGEVVSGHADRHVRRVQVAGGTFYLKRQHVVGWRERWRNRRAGFGWVSRCEREGALLAHLEAQGLPAPRWVAFGSIGGCAFLLVEEVPGAVDLRKLLARGGLSETRRRALAARVGDALGRVHAAGFSTPDLGAKHVLVHPRTLEITFLDWQSSVRSPFAFGGTDIPVCAGFPLVAAQTGMSVPRSQEADRPERAARGRPVNGADALGALSASLLPGLASGADRLRALAAYRARRGGRDVTLLPAVRRAEIRHANRRSVRDQLHPDGPRQRLVWLAGEAVCAVPEAAAVWSVPADGQPFYGPGPVGACRVRFAGREAVLLRGRAFAPLGRLWANMRAVPWRSPGVTHGRVLFHLERYGVPAPRLLAFGQKLTSAAGAEWFSLYSAPAGVGLRKWRRVASSKRRAAVSEAISALLGKLHAAGAVLTDPAEAFAVDGEQVSIADPRAVRIVKRVTDAMRARDVRAMATLLGAA